VLDYKRSPPLGNWAAAVGNWDSLPRSSTHRVSLLYLPLLGPVWSLRHKILDPPLDMSTLAFSHTPNYLHFRSGVALDMHPECSPTGSQP